MRFADDLLARYLRHFKNGEPESLELFVQSVLEQMDHKDLLEIFETSQKEELNKMLGEYLNNHLNNKLNDATFEVKKNNMIC